MQPTPHHPIFRPDGNCREVVTASHAAIAIDCANYYQALHESIVRARHSVFVVGWDIDSRIKLLRGERLKGVKQPARLYDLIRWKAETYPEVQIYHNRWDFSLFMAKERELLGKIRWRRNAPPNVHYWQDSTIPTGGSHHQKIITVDDEIAFCGGMDIALKRWDNRAHMPRNHNRIDPLSPDYEALTFEPYHDTQMLVSGEAAQALAQIARERWEFATESTTVPMRSVPAPTELPHCWPPSLQPDFRDVEMGISLTVPHWGEMQPLYQIEQLYLDSIAEAERFIYIENQFLCRLNIAEALNKRLREKPELQVLLVSSNNPNGIVEGNALWHGRMQFHDVLMAGGVQDRVAMAYPVSRVNGVEKAVRVHSKLMTVDDKFLRIGSSNINNRSMRLDTECDLLFTGDTEESRRAIADIRNDLIREHTGYELSVIEEKISRPGKVGDLLNYLSTSRQHLYKIDDSRYRSAMFTGLAKRIADPEDPLLPIGVSMIFAKVKFLRLFLVVAAIAALALVWKVTPLAEYANPETVVPMLEQVRNTPWAVPVAMLIYTVGTLAFFPHMAMTGTIVIVFSPVQAFSIAMIGSLGSGAIGFFAGKKLGLRSMRALVGDTAEKISLYAKKGGIIGITLLRLLPIAPYTAVNLALGMLEIPFITFMVGTFLGTLPGTLIAAYLGASMLELWQNPNMENLGVIAAGLGCWIAVIGASHYAARQWKKHRSKPA